MATRAEKVFHSCFMHLQVVSDIFDKHPRAFLPVLCPPLEDFNPSLSLCASYLSGIFWYCGFQQSVTFRNLMPCYKYLVHYEYLLVHGQIRVAAS